MISSTGVIDCALNEWILTSMYFLMFCKKLNTFQKTYHMHYVHKISIHINYLSLGRKVMTNLDSILKSRDITLPTNVRLVKAMVFPVVMYGCESWEEIYC